MSDEKPNDPNAPVDPQQDGYAAVEDPDWVRAVDAVAWQKNGEAYYKDLPCPHCTHKMQLTYLSSYRKSPFAKTSAAKTRYAERCQCQTAHPPREAGKGCGRYGSILSP